MSKLLKEKYKTYENARKRAAFENGVALSEYKSGIMRHVYHYTVVAETETHYPEGGTYITPNTIWRVQREKAQVQS